MEVIDQSAKAIVQTVQKASAQVSGPIPLPTKINKITVLRSPHVNKKSREQFEMRTHKRLTPFVWSPEDRQHVGYSPVVCRGIRARPPITVLPFISVPIACCMSISFSGSRAAIASSKRIIGASFKRARAMESRWRSPPERV